MAGNSQSEQTRSPKLSVLWKQYKQDKSANVLDWNRQELAWRHLAPLHTLRVASLKPQTILRWREKQTVCDSTVARDLQVLSAVLRWAAKSELITYIPYIPRPDPTPPRSRWLNGDEISALVKAAEARPNWMKTFVLLALYTAQRRDAILSLKWSQVDIANRVIDFNAGLTQASRRKGRGHIPVSDELYAVLSAVGSQRSGDYVIHNSGKRPTAFYYQWAKLIADAGLGKDVTPHVIRHTVATMLVKKGIPIIEVSKLLGHKNSTITEEVYAKFTPDYLASATGAIKL